MDSLISRAVDLLWAFPVIILAVALVAIFGAGFSTSSSPSRSPTSTTSRGSCAAEVLSLREEDFTRGPRPGRDDRRVMVRHIGPNLVAPIDGPTLLRRRSRHPRRIDADLSSGWASTRRPQPGVWRSTRAATSSARPGGSASSRAGHRHHRHGAQPARRRPARRARRAGSERRLMEGAAALEGVPPLASGGSLRSRGRRGDRGETGDAWLLVLLATLSPLPRSGEPAPLAAAPSAKRPPSVSPVIPRTPTARRLPPGGRKSSVAAVRRASGRAEMAAAAGEAIGLPAAAAPAVWLGQLGHAVGAERVLWQVGSGVQPGKTRDRSCENDSDAWWRGTMHRSRLVSVHVTGAHRRRGCTPNGAARTSTLSSNAHQARR